MTRPDPADGGGRGKGSSSLVPLTPPRVPVSKRTKDWFTKKQPWHSLQLADKGEDQHSVWGSGGEWELVDREDALPLWKSLPLLNMTDSFLPFPPSSPYSLALSICLLPPCLSQKLFAVLSFSLFKVIIKVIPLTDFINCTFLWKNKFNALCSLHPLTQNEVHKYLRNSIKTTQVNTTEHENEDGKKMRSKQKS